MDENIQTIKIDKTGRYILIVEGISDMKFLSSISKLIRHWWDGDDKFLVLGAWDEGKVRIERLENDR